MNLIARFITFSFMHLLLGIFVFSAAVVFVATDKETIKTTVTEAGTYQDVVPALIDSFEQEDEVDGLDNPPSEEMDSNAPSSNEEVTLSFEDPEIRRLFEQSVTPEILQTEFEGLLDDVFIWLDGQQNELTFSIDLNQVKTNLIANTTEYVNNRVATLPLCTTVEQAENADIFNLQCQPPGFTPETTQSEIEKGVGEFELFEDPVITQDTLSSSDSDDGEDNKTIEERLEPIRNIYGRFQPGFYAVAASFFASIVAFMLARMPITKAVTLLGRNFFFAGLAMALGVVLIRLIAPDRIRAAAEGEDQLAVLGVELGVTYVDKVLSFVLILVLIIAALGFVAMVPAQISKLRSSAKHKK